MRREVRLAGFGGQGINVPSGAQTITITNTGTTPVTVTGLSFTGTGAGAFAFAPITFPVSLAAGASLPVSITFTPTGPGDVSAILNISTTEIGTRRWLAIQPAVWVQNPQSPS